MIELKNVSKYYTNNGVVSVGLKNVNLKLEKNEIVAIIGESGSGKSTLLNVICGVDTYEDGEIIFNGAETSYFNQDDMDNFRKKNVSFIYQNYNIIESYTVLQNVMIPLIINGVDRKTAKQRALELIKRVGLSHRIKNKGSKLSGGEKQRCVIARALATDAEILACDEPTGNLDAKTGAEIIELIKEISKDKIVLIVSHNYDQVKDMVTRTIRVSDGEIVEDSRNEKIENTDTPTELDLKSNKTKRKCLYFFTKNNLFSTPKKNIFISLVFIAYALIGFLIFIFCMQLSRDVILQDNDYYNTQPDRLVLYDKNHNPLDKTKIESISGEKYYNAFYENTSFTFDCKKGDDLYSDYYIVSYHLPSSTNIIKGSFTKGDYNCFIVFPKDDYYSGNRNIIEKYEEIDSFFYKDWKRFEPSYYTITGYGTSTEITYPMVVFAGNGGEEVTNEVYKEHYYNEIAVTVNGLKLDCDVSFQDLEDCKVDGKYVNTLVISGYNKKDVESIKVEQTLDGLYNFEIKVDNIIYNDSLNSSSILILPEDDAHYIEDQVYECVIYTNNVNKTLREINSAGFDYVYPAKSINNHMSVLFICFCFFTAIAVCVLILLAFVVYAILYRTFVSRKNDYAILRSMGLVKKDMARIVRYELMVESLFTSCLTVAGIYIASIFIKKLNTMLSFNTWWFMLSYFVVMLLLGIFIANRFNKRLFKFSLNTTIKGEGASND